MTALQQAAWRQRPTDLRLRDLTRTLEAATPEPEWLTARPLCSKGQIAKRRRRQ